MKLTWFDANSWLIEVANIRVLVDPWLVGDLVFADAPWLVRGFRTQPIATPENIDLILLSQGLADHAHPETLKSLDKSIPIVASPDGAAVALSLGFQSVQSIGHGERLCWDERINIDAFVGAPVGPTKKENAYVLSFLADNPSESLRLYYEPHGYPDVEHLQTISSVDVAITPMADQTLLGVAPVVRGLVAAPQIAELLSPQVMLPTAEAGNVSYSGLIAPVLTTKGGADDLRSRLQKQGSTTKIVQPVSGEPLLLAL